MIATAMLLGACSAENTADQEVVQEPDAPITMVGLTRSSAVDDELGDIRVFLTNEGTTVNGLFKLTGETEWTTLLKLKSGTRTYRLYGFMPDDGTLSGSLPTVDADNAVLHLQGLKPIMNQDYCIVTGVYQGSSASDRHSATRGDFSFEYVSSRQNYINLLFDHLTSHVVFSVKVGADYNTVRTIKIKRMSLRIADVSSVSADVTLTNGVGINSTVYSNTGTEECVLTLKETEQTLTTTSTAVCSAYVIPATALLAKLQLVTEFDVYDKQGNKIAERTATNQLEDPLEELQQGEDRTLMITVAPSYLYVLSDDDMNNPTIKVES